ncbi:hypothetical protein MnTg02_00683 [bacterium MnTg02]|nr:hypothetical protein MnTg02_00683 [bacterium MnTg02]
MGRAKGVILALRAFGKTVESPWLAQGANPVTPASQYLVRISLMPNIPDQSICRRIEDFMERHRQIHDTQPCSQMTTRHGHRVYRLLAKLRGKLREITIR